MKMASEIPTKINFHLESWLENAGIVGLCRILGENNVEFKKQGIAIPVSALDDFSENYFNFFSNKQHYGRLTRYQRIIDFRNILIKWQENNFAGFDESKLKTLNDWYRDILKYSTKSNSYKKVYKLINSDFDVLNA